MNALTRKAVADVTRRVGRTVLIVLGITIGVMGITAVNQANSQIGGSFLYSTDPTAIPSISMTVDTPALPASVTAAIAHLPAVQKMQIRAIYSASWRFEGRTADHTMQIFAYPDMNAVQLWPFRIISGRLPGAGEIVLDSRNLQEGYPAAIGETISVTAPDGHLVSLRVAGLSSTQGWAIVGNGLTANPFGYVKPAGFAQLTATPGANNPRQEILVKTPDAAVVQTNLAMMQILQRAHIRVDPKSSWRYASGSEDTQLSILGPLTVIRFLAVLSLLLVSSMIFNAVTTLLTEQIQIIGTMKALGGTRWRIIGSYLLTVAIYSVAGTTLGLELGLGGGYQLALLLASTIQLNVGSAAIALGVGPFQLTPWVLLTSCAVGLLIPNLAALLPLLTGTRITVREAIAAYGVRRGEVREIKRVWRWELQWVPQLVWLGLRGLFRRPERTTFTLVALALAGAVFLAIQMGNASLGLSIAEGGSPIANPDVRIDLAGSSQQMVGAIRSLPNVESAVPITFADANVGEGRIFLTALPADQYLPHLVAGRWLHLHEQGSVVLNAITAQRLQLNVGERLALTITEVDFQQTEAAEVRWTIVGLLHASDYVSGSADTQGALGEAFVTPDTLNGAFHRAADFTDRIIVHSWNHSPQALQQLQRQITATLARFGEAGTLVRTIQQLDQGFTDPLPTIYSLFYAAAIIVAVVGLLSLALTLATSVLEHRLEIGILRSLGARGWQVSLVFCVEGLTLALLACAFGIVFGLPGGVLLIQILAAFLGLLDVTLSPWLVLNTVLFIVVVALVASAAPALVASRMKIRSILHYE